MRCNFDDYPLLRMREIPRVEVHILTRRDAPGGVGGQLVPRIAPAVAHGVFAATGARLRTLPPMIPLPGPVLEAMKQ